MDNHYWLVVSTILKNMKVSGKDDIPIMENKKCLKPPTNMDVHDAYSTIIETYQQKQRL